MNREEALKLLRAGPDGIAEWNRWRKIEVAIPDLVDADLTGLHLRYVNLSNAILLNADLRRANLGNAKLIRANLKGANLSDANLVRARLDEAELNSATLINADARSTIFWGADLYDATLMNTNLEGARLGCVNFWEADLNGTRFADAEFYGTCLLCDLTKAKGLEKVSHIGASPISVQSLIGLKEELPEVFLRGCGLQDEEIEYFRGRTSQPIRFYSCFISYSHADKPFARRLHDQLQARGIRCWLDEHQMLPGDKMHVVVNEAIRLWDKVLLCASKDSLTSWWVDKEITAAMEKEKKLWKEREKEVLALIPLNLDGYLFSDEWQSGWKNDIKSRLAADFTGWENDNAKFDREFEKVVRAMTTDDGGREKPPKAML